MINAIKRRNIDMDKVCKYLTYAFLILMVVWRIPFLNKGIDYTDTGFNMTKYRDLFVDSSENSIGIYFTQFVGSLIYNALPAYQLLVFRVLHLAIWSATFLIIFFTFRRPEPSYYNVGLSLLLLITSSYQKMGEAIFSYYPFSMLMVAIGIFLMYTGLIKDKKIRLLASGIVLGVNFGVRLPNLLFFSLVVVVFWYYVCKKEIKIGFIRSGIMLGGVAIGFAAMACFEVIMLGAGSAGDSLGGYVNLASDSNKNHGIFNQIIHIFQQIFLSMRSIVFYIGPVVLASLVFILVYKAVFKKNMHKTYVNMLMYIVVALASIFWFELILVDRVTVFSFVHHFGLISLVLAVISVFALANSHPELSSASLIAIISAGCIILGTDLGISRFADVLPQLCVSLMIAATYIKPQSSKTKLCSFVGLYFNKICKVTVVVLIGITTMMSVAVMVPETYNDASVDKLTATPSESIVTLRGMKTTSERAQSLSNLYYAMQNENIKDKPVAVIGMFPLIYNIADNEKYFKQPCIDYNSVSADNLEEQYESKKSEGIYPVIVYSRLHMIQNGLNELCDDPQKLELFDKMRNDCEYTLVFTDENFDVYAPVAQ
ncbi:MAG: hypothetical protein E7566_02545 [Ruminococcaceae bacterium]|nr:hypothetical protein [Oscillospiraceae bacterium]